MIQSLAIKNYALIEEVELAPSAQLNIITGETGAGKSIMLGAIGLLLGNRADVKVLFDESKKCTVEGTFDVKAYQLQSLFDELDLDYEDPCVIRREISPSGKSRAFINDTPVTLDVLKRIGPKLLDIHSQHETLELGRNKYQLQTLDAFAQHPQLIKDHEKAFAHYQKIHHELEALKSRARESAEQLDYKQFIFKELQDAQLQAGDQATLEEELSTLEHAEEIKESLSMGERVLDEGEFAILDQLKAVANQLGKINGYSANYQALYERVESSLIELKDLAAELANENDKVQLDPHRLQEVKERIDLIFRLQQKHGMGTIDDLIQLRDELEAELQSVESLDEDMSKLQSQLAKAEGVMSKTSKALTESRRLAALDLATEIEKIIRTIGIENGQVEVAVTGKSPAADGADQIEILFTANKGMPARPLKDVASGGEFSRLIFAVKFLIARKSAMPTVIFDEIDTGVSGEVAIQMVKLMKKMGDHHQIISISHLPQFAAAADQHYFVYKDHESIKSVSKIKQLDAKDRVNTIAQMIGGQNPSAKAQESARELLDELA